VKILVVDDEELVRTLTVHVLERAGYEVVSVDSARGALELVASGERIDLVVSDVVMPVLSGVDLLTELQARHPDLPVVLMTGGSPEPERTSKALELGASAIVYKPYTHAQLCDAVAQALA
jgi:two-component system, cell cycle sensor histidine kinase and response regulator CckA